MPHGKDSGEGHERKEIDPSTDRRKLMKYMAATGVVAGAAGCAGGGGGGGSPTDTGGPSTPSVTPTTPEDTPTAPPAQTIPKGGTFIEGTTSTSRAINVLRIGDGTTSDRVFQLVDGGYNREGQEYSDIMGLWFESLEVADDLKSVTLTLRDNLKFGKDYGQLTVDDYIYTWNNIWTADWFPYTYGYAFTVGKNDNPIKPVKVDDLTIRLEVPNPRPFFPYNEPLSYNVPIPKGIAQPYVKKKDSKGLFKDDEIVKTTFNGNLGPWDLKNYKEESVVVFERADNYYLRKWAKEDDSVPNLYSEAPFFDQFKQQKFQKQSTMRQALKAGEIDRASIPATKVGAFEGQKGLTIYENPFIAYSDYLGINQRVNGWEGNRSRQVRHAFANLYDRQFVVKNILKGRATPQRTLYPQWGPYYPKGNLRSHKGSISRAKQLLKDGTSDAYGYSGDTFVDGNGEQVELNMVYVGGGTLDKLRASYTKKRFEKAGFKINEQTTSWAGLITNYFYTNNPASGVSGNIGYGEDGKKHPSVYNYGPWDKAVSSKPWDLMHTLGFSYGPLDPAGTVAALFGEQETFNAYGYTPAVDLVSLRDQAKTGKSLKSAKSTIEDMFVAISRDQPVVFESNYYGYTGYNSRVKNLPQSPAANFFVDQNIDTMYFSDGKSGR